MITRYLYFLLLLQCTSCQIQHYFNKLTCEPVSLQSISTNSSTKEYRIKAKLGLTFQPNTELRQEWTKQKQQLKIRKVSEWSLEPTPYLLPDIEDHETVLSLAEMSYNAYTELGKSGEWYDLGSEWRIVSYKSPWDERGLTCFICRTQVLVGRQMGYEAMCLEIQIDPC